MPDDVTSGTATNERSNCAIIARIDFPNDDSGGRGGPFSRRSFLSNCEGRRIFAGVRDFPYEFPLNSRKVDPDGPNGTLPSCFNMLLLAASPARYRINVIAILLS